MTPAERITEINMKTAGDDESFECQKCHELCELGDGLVPTKYCNLCAQELVEELENSDQLARRGMVDVGELKVTIELLKRLQDELSPQGFATQTIDDEISRLEGIVAGDDINWSEIATNFEEALTKVEAERDGLLEKLKEQLTAAQKQLEQALAAGERKGRIAGLREAANHERFTTRAESC